MYENRDTGPAPDQSKCVAAMPPCDCLPAYKTCDFFKQHLLKVVFPPSPGLNFGLHLAYTLRQLRPCWELYCVYRPGFLEGEQHVEACRRTLHESFFGHANGCPRMGEFAARDLSDVQRARKHPPPIRSDKLGQLFPVGRIHTSEGARHAIEDRGRHALAYVIRHASGQWYSRLRSFQVRNNRRAIRSGRGEILSVYPMGGDDFLWVNTREDRSATELFLLSE